MMTKPHPRKVDYTSDAGHDDWTTVDHKGKTKIRKNNKTTNSVNTIDRPKRLAKKHNNGSNIRFDGIRMDTLAKADDIKQYRSPTEIMQEHGKYAVDKQDKWITPVMLDVVVRKDQHTYPIRAKLLALIEQFQRHDPSLTVSQTNRDKKWSTAADFPTDD
eukprot:15324870-Ditylum_brightwellii.AAC.1